jgi:hypothetical protein
MTPFSPAQYLPEALLAALTDMRVQRPGFALEAAQKRVRRQRIALDGKLNIVAADHPARFVFSVGSQPLAMADRRAYLARLVRVLSSSLVDGIMASMDILEDLLVIDELLKQAGQPSLLDERVLIASLNRGGLAGCVWELDDPMTGATAASCKAFCLDGAKTLLRVDPSESASLTTLKACADVINECNALELPMFLEPLPVTKTDKGYTVVKTAEAVARLVGVASALGDSSRYLWLKLPYCEDFATVARSTTMPILLLGGESAGSATPFLAQLHAVMASGANVRGAMVGRNVVFPGDDDPMAVAEAAGGIIHEGFTVEAANKALDAARGRDLARLHFTLPRIA